MDCVERIGHADEQNLRQVDRSVQVMILTGLSYQKKSLEVRGREETYVEGHISHRIEDLKQRRGWVTVVVRLTDLINFVSAIIPVINRQTP